MARFPSKQKNPLLTNISEYFTPPSFDFLTPADHHPSKNNRSGNYSLTAPSVKFRGLKHYARISNQIVITVQANDDIGIVRIELYLDEVLFAVNNVTPNAPNVSVSFNWNTSFAPNGKHRLQARAYNTADSFETANLIVISHNNFFSQTLPTATFIAAPSSISAGQSATLNWTTDNAGTVSLSPGIGAVALSGARTVTPAVTTTYMLTATNTTGSINKTATVTVTTPATGDTITLNPAITYQTMSGWEATDFVANEYSPAWNNYKNQLFDLAVNDLGINRIRLGITSGTENPIDYYAQWRSGQITEQQFNARRYETINDDADPNIINPNGFKWSLIDDKIDNVVLPMRQRLQARGEQLYVNVNYGDFGSAAFKHRDNPAEYAEFVLAAYRHIQSKYGFVPDAWEIILEPDTATANWSAGQVAQAIKAAGDRLTAAGYTPKFIAASTTNGANTPAFFSAIVQTAGALQYLDEISYHRYCCVDAAKAQQIAALGTQYNKKTAMLEWIGADYQTLHEDLKFGNVSAWQQFTLATLSIWGADSGDAYYRIDDTNPASPVLSSGSRTKFLRQYFKYIRRGAVRIGAASANSSFDPLAFRNTDGKYVVVVKAAAGGTFAVQGLPAGTYDVFYTTASASNQAGASQTIASGQAVSATIPAAGVITLNAR